jgi:hypothetical protein
MFYCPVFVKLQWNFYLGKNMKTRSTGQDNDVSGYVEHSQRVK